MQLRSTAHHESHQRKAHKYTDYIIVRYDVNVNIQWV